jgi:hypothetical protein
MWLADLGSSSNGGNNHSIKNYWNIFFIPFLLVRIIRLIPIMTGNFPPPEIGAARIYPTQGPFCTVQLFGAGTRKVQGCAAGLLQSVSEENVLWKSSHGPRHYSAAGRR